MSQWHSDQSKTREDNFDQQRTPSFILCDIQLRADRGQDTEKRELLDKVASHCSQEDDHDDARQYNHDNHAIYH